MYCVIMRYILYVCWHGITYVCIADTHICDIYYYIIQITSMIIILTQLEIKYDKNLVLLTRREYIKLQQKLEECERRHNEIFEPNIGKSSQYMDTIAIFVET